MKSINELNLINLRKEKDNLIYDLEKKIMSLEKLNKKQLSEIENLVTMNSQSENFKQNQIESLKSSTVTTFEPFIEATGLFRADSIMVLISWLPSIPFLVIEINRSL